MKKKNLPHPHPPQRGGVELVDPRVQAQLKLGEGPEGAFRLEGERGVAVEPLPAQGRKCARSWKVLPEVGSDARYPDLSLRDADAVAWWDAMTGRAARGQGA